MKLKNVNLTLLILGVLIFSSFAFYVSAQENTADAGSANAPALYAGQNTDTTTNSTANNSTNTSSGANSATNLTTNTSLLDGTTDNGNLTQELADKISALTNSPNSSSQQVSLNQIQQMVNQVLDSQNQQITLPKVDMSTIKILPQNYSGYSKTTAEKKKAEDAANYIAAVFYIFASNSPQPITSASDVSTVMGQVANQITSAIDSNDTQTLDQLSQSGGKILDQLKAVPVPQDLINIHIKAMQYAMYAQSLEKTLKPTTDDPIGEMVNYYKVEALLQSLISFSSDVESTLSQYNLNYSDIQSKVKNYGLELPNLPTSNSTTDTTTSTTGSN